MKRKIAAALSVLAVGAGVGWKLTSHRESATGLKEIRLRQDSERSYPGPRDALAGIRIRLNPGDFGYELRADHEVPPISVAPR